MKPDQYFYDNRFKSHTISINQYETFCREKYFFFHIYHLMFKFSFSLQYLISVAIPHFCVLTTAGLLRVLRLFHCAVFPEVRFAAKINKNKSSLTRSSGPCCICKKKNNCVDKMESSQVKSLSLYSLNLFTLPVSSSSHWSVSSSCYLHIKSTIAFTSAPLDSSQICLSPSQLPLHSL